MQTKEVTSYSFYEFCRDAQAAILEGYSFDFDSNTNFPQQFGSMLTAIMIKHNEVEIEKIKVDEVKQESQPEPEQVPAIQVEEKPVVKAGRKLRV